MSKNGKKTTSFRDRFLARQEVKEDQGPEPEWRSRIMALLSAQALRRNYEAIQALVPEQAILPMVKANAYGHGASWASRILIGMPGLYALGVATLEEGRELRLELGAAAKSVRIMIFSGTVPWSEEKGQFCEKFSLTPVIASDSDWQSFFKNGWPDKISYELKFNTGMNRLGISPGLSKSISRNLKEKPAEWHPHGVFTHFAIAEDPTHKLTKAQRASFVEVRKDFANACPSTHFHAANSAGIWNAKLLGLDGLTDLVRPGLSLYGVTPWAGAPLRGLQSVMTLQARVIQTRLLKRGESMGYGAAYVATESDQWTAIISAGYADGLMRSWTNRGFVSLDLKEERFLGIVSMDLSGISCTSQTRVGDWAQILGPQVDIWAQAKAAGTIPYELLTSVGSRVQRIYG